jgi:tripartite-type tricarboxylate transporter receptor subunit TctC
MAIHTARAALAALVLAASAAAFAQSWPERPVKIVVPFASGGPADIYARVLGQKLQAALGQPFVVEDRPGGGSIVGTEAVHQSPPDGYTLLMMSNTHTVNESLIAKKPFELMRDFVPVAPVNYSDLVMVIHPSVPANNLKEFIALAKSKPGALNYASSGPGTPYHMAGELFKAMAGVDMVHVPYKGAQPALTDVIAGQCQLMFATSDSVIPYIKAGRLRALAVTTAQRSPSLPDLPTIAEAGVPGFESITWHGVVVPSATPPATVERLNRAINSALREKDLVERLNGLGAEIAGGTPQDFAAYIQREIPKWTKVVKDSGAKAE